MVKYVVLARLPEGRLADFDAYERAVLPLLGDYGGNLEQRLRTPDNRVEIHVVSFPDEADFAAYRADPRRMAAQPLLESSGATHELLPVYDV
jgi:hypothetical protein